MITKTISLIGTAIVWTIAFKVAGKIVDQGLLLTAETIDAAKSKLAASKQAQASNNG